MSCIFTAFVLKNFTFYLFLLRFNIIVEYIILIYFISLIIKESIVKKIVLFSIIPFSIYYIFDFIKSRGSIPNDPSIVEFLVFIVILIYFFFEKMKISVQFPIYQTIYFWICVGLFLYFTGSFFFLLLISNVNKSDIILTGQMTVIYNIVTIIKNLLLGSALLVKNDPTDDANEFKIPNEMDLDNFSPKLT